MISAALYPRCKEVETAMHTFFLCPFAKEVWNHIPLKSPVHIAEDSDFKTTLVCFRQAICLPPSGIRFPILPWIVWTLWLARNKLIFEDKTSRPIEIATKGLSAALEWNQDRGKTEISIQPLPRVRPPPRRPIIGCENPCFVDAAWDASSQRAGVAWILNKDLPTLAQSGYRTFEFVSSPLMAESLALRHGIEMLLLRGISTATIFSDCLTLIRAINTKSQIKEIYGVLQDIYGLSSQFGSIVFQFISRSQNDETDVLAKQALQAQHLSFVVV
ncbi:uncharacterized protein LOC108815283 [Raphanus sativus]|uniref:Uncharacterized protein LOC108815283 n=1 Tax=Raphanus sativus TaxID=3726 RepID=A0A6J0K8Y5_RAPSA|nr:uncharacterized protein LOC108815283 [Raphanus sativus]